MPSTEEPRLTWFELEVCVFQFRLAVAPDQTALYGVKSEDGKIHSTDLPFKGNEQRIESLLESLHWLIHANGILDLPETMPREAFLVRPMAVESVHIRIAYSDGRKWASMYLPAEVPAQVQALIEQAKYLGAQELKRPAGTATTQTE